MKSLIFIAPPAAGKGTQSEIISKKYNIPSISTGDLLRDARNQDNEIGRIIREKQDKGLLVDDEIVLNLLKNRLNESDCANGYILDGFPRNTSQAIAYEKILNELNKELGIVILLEAPKELLMKRITGRISCPKCKAVYNSLSDHMKPVKEGICNNCGTSLVRRSDDNEKVLKKGYKKFEDETLPVVDYYRKNNNIIEVDSNGDARLVFKELERKLEFYD